MATNLTAPFGHGSVPEVRGVPVEYGRTNLTAPFGHGSVPEVRGVP